MNDATDAVREVRQTERYVAVEPLEGICEGYEVSILNVGTAGMQIRHLQPIRIGQRTTLIVECGEVSAEVLVQVVWSQLANGFFYRSGLRLVHPNAEWSAAVELLLQAGAVVPDEDSLRRKRERDEAREERRKSGPYAILTPRPEP